MPHPFAATTRQRKPVNEPQSIRHDHSVQAPYSSLLQILHLLVKATVHIVHTGGSATCYTFPTCSSPATPHRRSRIRVPTLPACARCPWWPPSGHLPLLRNPGPGRQTAGHAGGSLGFAHGLWQNAPGLPTCSTKQARGECCALCEAVLERCL